MDISGLSDEFILGIGCGADVVTQVLSERTIDLMSDPEFGNMPQTEQAVFSMTMLSVMELVKKVQEQARLELQDRGVDFDALRKTVAQSADVTPSSSTEPLIGGYL